MGTKKRWATAIAGALLAMAAMAPTAPATEVKPAGESYTATAGATVFISDNGTGSEVTCENSSASGQVTPIEGNNGYDAGNANMNSGGTVIGPLSGLKFENNCITKVGEASFPTTVGTGNSGGEYSITADGFRVKAEDETEVDVARAYVNIPGNDTLITVEITPELACTINVPARGTGTEANPLVPIAASAGGRFDNGQVHEGGGVTHSTLSVNGQVPFGGSCLGLGVKSPGVFYADGMQHGTVNTTVYTIQATEPNTVIEVLPH